jgi:dTDP-4-dehydrorhamnose 3,5-epimerase
MKIKKNQIQGVLKISFLIFNDARGKFSRIYSKEFFPKLKKQFVFKQVNLSSNPKKYTLRGMHYQSKSSGEHKFIICVSGSIQLVLFDTRRKSKTYLKTISFSMDSNSEFGVFVPAGVATGWITLKNETNILYLMGANYDASLSKNFNYCDPLLRDVWKHKAKIISKKDKNAKFFRK